MDQIDLPPEVEMEMQVGSGALDDEALQAVAQIILKKRDEAVNGRKASGIEDVWLAAEEAYIGMDDLNRSEFDGAKWAKPTSIDGPLNRNVLRQGGAQANAFVPLTARYVDAGVAKICEITLPLDDKPFSMTATPVPEVLESSKDESPVLINGQPAQRDAKPSEVTQDPTAAIKGQQEPQTVDLKVKDLAAEIADIANEKAKKAEKRIYDWMVEGKYRPEMRKIIFDAGRIGVGVMKGPFPERITRKAFNNNVFEIMSEIIPACRWVDAWNIFPDPSCGESFQNGSYLFERDFLSPKSVAELKKQPGYIAKQLDIVLEQGPDGKPEDTNRNPGERNKMKETRFTVWHMTGQFDRKDLETLQTVGLFGKDGKVLEKFAEKESGIHAIVTLINDVPVKAVLNPLDSGELNYHAFPWRRRPGHWAGVGIAEQLRTPQRMINAATRAMLSNAGKSAGSQIVVDRRQIEPQNQNWTLTPDKIWYTINNATTDDIRKAFNIFEIPNKTKELLTIIQYAREMAEEVTNIPLISQGQSGGSTPDTFGAAQLQDNNANQLLRGIAAMLDECVTEPVVRQYYEWLMLDDDVPEDEKGDWNIDAHGSVAMVERHLQSQALMQMGNMVANPVYGIDPVKYAREVFKAQHLNPNTLQYTDAELEQMKKQPPQPAPQVQVAQIREAGATERAKQDTDRDTVYAQAEAKRVENEHMARMEELRIKERIAIMDYANKREITVEQVKAQLADTTIKENTRKELAAAELMVAQQEKHMDRQHEGNQNALDKVFPGAGKPNNSLVRDEMSTPTTP